ncbi:MAG: hypothetical protein CSA21_03450 [Deltaproteobacteria bacterium]|nr:MAG: hypothetical protein CSA21_03450 [Deltaproteobacteria bacterium]
MAVVQEKLEQFIREWREENQGNRQAFIELWRYLEGKAGVILEFHQRPGVTHSLRATHPDQQGRPLFVMVDVIEDTPRWLSVCFYGELITDPEGRGDEVPAGLLGEDAVCFDMETASPDLLAYIKARIDEAYVAAISA